MDDESKALTEKDFQEFISATGEEQWKILLAHAERNTEAIQKKSVKEEEDDK